MPDVRPLRALRFDAAVVGDLGRVVAPPYDVIGPDERARLAARHPANVVRLDLPAEEPGDGPDDRYRRAARALAGWRSDGTLRKDPHPCVYVYEQTYRLPGTDTVRTQRGFFARLRLEAFGPGSGVLPHERTLSGPREDRYKLLRATGVNTSPVVAIYDDPTAAVDPILRRMSAAAPDIEVTDDEGVGHRLWVVRADDEAPDREDVLALLRAASRGPLTIADGHHRYETALRYRDERRMTRSCEEDPAFDYLLTLLLSDDEPLTVLPTHRLLLHGGAAGAARSLEGAGALFDVVPATAAELIAHFEAAGSLTGGRGRFGLWTRDGGAWLTLRPSVIEPFLPPGGDALRSLDVTTLGVALERIAGTDPTAVAAGALAFTKSAADGVARVDRGEADAAFLLEPTPVAAILAVAREGDVMPQKSTYFYPKALTGLLINPHEW